MDARGQVETQTDRLTGKEKEGCATQVLARDRRTHSQTDRRTGAGGRPSRCTLPLVGSKRGRQVGGGAAVPLTNKQDVHL